MNKKGFTIVETIIAFVIISIVALAATSIITISKKNTKVSSDEILAVNFCNNSIAMLRAINERNSFDEFYNEYATAMSTIDIELPIEASIQFDVYVDNRFNQATSIEYAYKCEYTFELDGEILTLNISVIDDTGKTIYSSSYSTMLKETI